MPKINGKLLKFEGFQYAMLLDLNMEYYHIQITEDTSNLCIIIDPWGGYNYKRPSMGVINSPYIFQQKVNDLSQVF